MKNELNLKDLRINYNNYYDISIRQTFDKNQPNSFGVKKAFASPFKESGVIGDTNKGGSCNFDVIKIIPHCNGTHTECIGHILNTRDKILDYFYDIFILAELVTCESVPDKICKDNYIPRIDENDFLITKEILENLIEDKDLNDKALIIRTLPNDDSKLKRNYLKKPAPYFSNEAMGYLVEKGVKHLLVDLPSIDKANDAGFLSNHRIFWNIDFPLKEKEYSKEYHKTITEFIFVDEKIDDGTYLLNLQLAPFGLDATPSRPIIFKVE